MGDASSPIPAPPSLSLPKGGGAIRGIDEKFSVAPTTGTASLAIPLPVSPGRGGFAPSLAVTYDSGSGNSPFGLGWTLTLPSVSRKTERGLPRYRDGTESDVFLLSGAEDLVPGLTLDGRDSVEREGHRVDRYRPRVEAGDARIERWTRLADGDVHWRTVGRDNVTTFYGRSDAARISDPADRRRIFQWLVDESRDDRGNVIRYEYKSEDGVGIDGAQLFEKNRISAGFSQRYLKRVLYGNDRPGAADGWHFELVFDYGDHDEEASPEAPRSWPVRADPFSTHRAGFEIRTYRLCRRALLFHRFPELGGPMLVRSLVFQYASDTALTKLDAVTVFGHDPLAAEGERIKSAPPLAFTYTEPGPATPVQVLDTSSLENLPEGVDGSRYEWVDLDGEGVTGVLSELSDVWTYKRNLGGGRFAPAETVAAKPSVTNVSDHRHELVDLEGDGQVSVVHFAGPMPGHQDRGLDGEWLPFAPFQSQPNLAWDDPDLRFIDLDGDGRSDVLITRDDVFRWYPSAGRDGFLDAETVPLSHDEEKGPRVVFSDRTQSIFLADLSGDGLADMVRIRNGEVCYWANLGYGRFGPKVTMSDAPVFEAPDFFRPDRIRLADVDGSGVTDIIYLGGAAGPRYWLNQAGNGWGAAHTLAFPLPDQLSSVAVVDLLGTGTASLVWSSPLPGHVGAPLQFVDLLGSRKPHLLASVTNNLGGETRVTYAPSTRFYLEDKEAGIPWATKLPFPVHVVESVETRDHVTGLRFSSAYRYRHGFYDREEREFRGFGYVEQRDTESYPDFTRSGGHPVEEEHFLPPVIIKTWMHTGAYREGGAIARVFAGEYYREDTHPEASPLADTVLPGGLADAAEVRAAVRALKGQVLRRETYALDAGPDGQSQARARRPYTVAETAYEIRGLQPRGRGRHGVFRVHPSQAVTYQYERNVADPRTTHQLTLAVDDFGTVTRAASVAYARRSPSFDEQGRTTVLYTETDVLHQLGAGGERDPYRLGLAAETRTFELTGLPSRRGLYEHAELREFLAASTEIPHEATADGRPRKRLLARQRVTYYSDDLLTELPPGRPGRQALPYRSYQLALTPGLIPQLYGSHVTDAMLSLAGHHRFAAEGEWWIPSGRATFDPTRFFLPVEFHDPFGAPSFVEYDRACLLPTSTRDALGNRVEVRHDYRTLAPTWMSDANRNRSAARVDALGLVVATAVMGKEGLGEGDSLDDPTRRLEYDVLRWLRERRPAVVRAYARERHGDPDTRWQESHTYTGGFGQEVMTKVRAEPERGSSEARWVGTGRTLFNNKGLPIKQYEPFFSRTPDYEDESDVVEQGVTSVIRYDALGRVVRTEFPNQTLSRVEFDPWRQVAWDPNDTVLESEWYSRRIGGTEATSEQRAARLAERHAGTPAVTHFDNLGRAFLAEADNGPGADGRHRLIRTHTTFDVVGNVLALTDPRGNDVMRYRYDAAGRLLHQESMDGGPRWILLDVAGNPLLTWDRERAIVQSYDELRRPTGLAVRTLSIADDAAVPDPVGGGTEVLAQRLVYGDSLMGAEALNLRGRVHQQYDGAGVATNEAYDFKGNLLRSSRRLLQSHRDRPDWRRAEMPLEEEPPFVSRVEYDALDRAVRLEPPDGSEILPIYNEAGLLGRMQVRHRGAGAPTPFVEDIDYDAKGQRTRIVYGNGAVTTYTYDHFTFRLAALTTERPRSPRRVQALAYTYDPAGNVLEVRDEAQPTVFFRNAVVEAHSLYEYDALYRLVRAQGREHAGTAGVQWDEDEFPRMRVVHENDTRALRRYTEAFEYDDAGNILVMAHDAGEGTWRRRYEYATASNRLLSTSVPEDPIDAPLPRRYVYDARGNMTRMPHLPALDWDFANQLHMSQRQVAGSEVVANRTFYAYDAAGQRVRKVAEKEGGLTEERVYLGGWEVFRTTRAGALERRRETLHLMDDTRRVALIETLTDGAGVRTPAIRYQLDNHLGSASVELDEEAEVISYEEYHPYGTTAYHSARGAAEVSLKRYRYTGMERDEETELAYHTARYYAPWLGRWTSVDPVGVSGGANVYAYSYGNPIRHSDPSGSTPPDEIPAHPGLTVRPQPRRAFQDPRYREFVRLQVLARRLGSAHADLDYARSFPGQQVWDECGFMCYQPRRPATAEQILLEEGVLTRTESNRIVPTFTLEPEFQSLWRSGTTEGNWFSEQYNAAYDRRHSEILASEEFDAYSHLIDLVLAIATMGVGTGLAAAGRRLLASTARTVLALGDAAALARLEPQLAASAIAAAAEAGDVTVITIRYTEAMARSASDANFLRFGVEWAQSQGGFLVIGSRSAEDSALRAIARRFMDRSGVSRAGRDAMHPLDSVINPFLEEGSAGTTYYFGNRSVNRSFGGQLGNAVDQLGLQPGTRVRIRFENFPSYEVAPPMAPVASPPNLRPH